MKQRGDIVQYMGGQLPAIEKTVVWHNRGNGAVVIEHPEGSPVEDYELGLNLNPDKRYATVLEISLLELNEVVELPAVGAEFAPEQAPAEEEAPLLAEKKIVQTRSVQNQNPPLPGHERKTIEKAEIKDESPEGQEVLEDLKDVIEGNQRVVNQKTETMQVLAESAIAYGILQLNEETQKYHILGKPEYDMCEKDKLAQFLANTPEYSEFVQGLVSEREALHKKLLAVLGIGKTVANRLCDAYITETRLREAVANKKVEASAKVKELLTQLLG